MIAVVKYAHFFNNIIAFLQADEWTQNEMEP